MIDENIYKTILKSAFINHYLEASDEWTNDAELRSIPALIYGFVKPKINNLNILDLGCGAGKDVEYFAKLGNTVIGVDVCSHDNWSSIGLLYNRTSFILDNFLQIRMNMQFDIILDNGCFHHQHPNTYLQYLSKAQSLLKSTGHLVISTFKTHDNRIDVDCNGRLHKYFTDEELSQLLTDAGFIIANQIDIYRIKKNDYYRVTFARKYGPT